MPDPTTEERLARLEDIADRLIAYAREHAWGRAILARLGLS